jgi:adenylate cyclase
MVEKAKEPIKIDLNQFKLHIRIEHKIELTLHFDSPSRRFYLSVIAFVVNEMQKLGRITSIPLEEHFDLLALLNETVGGSAGSSEEEHLLPRIYKKWKDALPNLEEARLFKILGRKKQYDGIGKTHQFSEAEKDSWANLFEYKGSGEHVRLRFSIDKLGASLSDVVIIYGEDPELINADAWESFITSIKQKIEGRPKPEDEYPISMKEPETSVSQERKWKTALPRWWKRPVLAVVIVFVVGVTALAVWKYYLSSPQADFASIKKMAFPLPDKPSIAVLPFTNMSADPQQEFFSDGLTEDIITALSKVPKLFVIASNSTFTYKGKSVKVQQVGEELGVQYMVEGSVRRAEDRVRITVQLIDTLTGHHIWAEKYDRDVKDIFAVQDEITKKIITALQVKLTEGEQAGVYARGTDNLEAYLKVMEANWLYHQSTKDGVLKARQLAKEAITLDQNYAFAYKLLGSTYGIAVHLGLSKNPRETIKRAIELNRKAIEFDDSLAMAHTGLGYWSMYTRQYDTAIAEGKRALELEPNSADVIMGYATILTFAGEPEEAIPLFQEALRLNPKPPNTYRRFLGIALRDSGRYEEAIAQAKKAVEREPNDLIAWVLLAASYSLAGHEEEARTAANEILRLNPKFSVARYQRVSPQKDRAVAKYYCDALRKAGLPE